MASGRNKYNRDAEAELNLPPGFRFHPTDEELIVHYLCKKVTNQFLPVSIIAEVDLYKHEPWLLPEKALFGHKEWYFFTPRDRKYPNGSRPNRAAGSGYWKATGADKHITPLGSNRPVGIKKALVFYAGKAPKGAKTNWIMHEYRLADINRTTNKKGTLRLDDWVLCRLYNKKNNWQKERPQATKEVSFEDETTDSFEAVEETAFDGHRTPESDVENDVFSATEVQQEVSNLAVTTPSQTMANTFEHRVKEDNDWFTEFNLNDLQNTFTGVSSTTGMSAAGYQDYYYSGLSSPMLPRIPSQHCMLPLLFLNEDPVHYRRNTE